jgi:hypothetical protein
MTILRSTTLAMLVVGCAIAQQPKRPTSLISAENKSIETVTAKVEQVLKFEDDSFEFIAYLVTYRGKQVVVEDPIGSTNHSVGDELRFIVVRTELSKADAKSKKLISFVVSQKGA